MMKMSIEVVHQEAGGRRDSLLEYKGVREVYETREVCINARYPSEHAFLCSNEHRLGVSIEMLFCTKYENNRVCCGVCCGVCVCVVLWCVRVRVRVYVCVRVRARVCVCVCVCTHHTSTRFEWPASEAEGVSDASFGPPSGIRHTRTCKGGKMAV